jgi:hypothetical protein
MPRKWQSAIRSPALAQKASGGSKPKGSRTLGEHEAKASGSGFVSKVTSSTGSGRKPRARQPGGQLHRRATAGAVLRSSVSVVVLADRNGCRSRQAARGHSRPCAKSAWTTRDGLASGRESAHGVKERRKPARPRQSGGYGGGLSTFIGNGGRESAHQGAPVDGRRLGPNQVVRFDERAMEAVLVFVVSPVGAISSDDLGKPRTAGTTGDVRGRSRSFIGEDNAPARRAPMKGRPDASILERGRGGNTVPHQTEAGPAPSSARPTGVGLSQDGPAPRRTNARWIRGLGSGYGKREGLRGQRDASRALGNRAVYGCSYRESIAEVGEKHLFRAS